MLRCTRTRHERAGAQAPGDLPATCSSTHVRPSCRSTGSSVTKEVPNIPDGQTKAAARQGPPVARAAVQPPVRPCCRSPCRRSPCRRSPCCRSLCCRSPCRRSPGPPAARPPVARQPVARPRAAARQGTPFTRAAGRPGRSPLQPGAMLFARAVVTKANIDGASVDRRVSVGGRRAPISSVVIHCTGPPNRRAWPRIEPAKERQGMRDREGRDRGDGYGTVGGRAKP